MNPIEKLFHESIEVKRRLLNSGGLNILEKMGERISEQIRSGGKLLICGNGGSAADAQHLAAEMLVRLRPMNNREGVPALALALDTSTITACGNDFGYDVLFERMIYSLGNSKDVLLGITTSGKSVNVIKAMQAAKEKGILVCGFLGGDGGTAAKHCDLAFIVPTTATGRIQECHITAGHALMENIEDRLIDSGYLHLEK